MKLASILVFLALLILPTWVLVSYYISQILTKGTKGLESSKPSPKFERFRSQHKVLFYLLLSLYGLLLFVTVGWMFYEVIAPRLGLSAIGIVWVLSLILIEAVAIVLSAMRQRRKIIGKLPPRPQSSSPNNVIQDWQLRYSNEMANTYLRYLVPTLLIAVGIIIVWVALLWLYTILL